MEVQVGMPCYKWNLKWLSHTHSQGQDHVEGPKSIFMSSESSRQLDYRSWNPQLAS